jgi:hypothetical protein
MKVVMLSAPRDGRVYPLPSSRKYSWYDFCSRLSRTLVHSAAGNTPSAIEPATFRLVAQCSKELRHFVLPALFRGPITFFCRLLDGFSRNLLQRNPKKICQISSVFFKSEDDDEHFTSWRLYNALHDFWLVEFSNGRLGISHVYHST